MKKNLIVVSVILVIIIGISSIIVYKNITDNKDNNDNIEDTNEEFKEKTYKLEKYADFDFDMYYNDHFSGYDDYIAINARNRKQEVKISIFKNGEEIFTDTENNTLRKMDKENVYYTSNSIINCNNLDKASVKYDYVLNYKNVFIVSKDKKYALINKNGKNVTEFIYDNISYNSTNSNYLFATKDNKVGVIDVNGNVIIEFEYDIEIKNYYGTKYEYYGEMINDDNKVYFILKIEDEYCVVDVNNITSLKDKSVINYSSELNSFYIENNGIVSYYETDGNLKKEFDSDESFLIIKDGKTTNANSVSSKNETKFRVFHEKNDPNKIYILNDKLEIETFSNIYYESLYDANKYYINNDIYVVKENDKYRLFSMSNKELLNEYITFKYIDLSNSMVLNNIYEENIFIACKSENKCGILDLKGKEQTEFKYELYSEHYTGFNLLKNGNEYVTVSSNAQVENIKCDNAMILDDVIWNAYDNSFKMGDNLYTKNCIKMNEKKLGNHYYLENNYIIAEIREECNYEDDRKCNYYIWDNTNQLITYENPDNVIIYYYLGFVNNRLYFKTDQGIHFIEL